MIGDTTAEPGTKEGSAEVLRRALSSLMVLQGLSETNPEAGKRLLKAMFSSLYEELREMPVTFECAIATMALSEYFNHGGDWSKGISCIAESLAKHTPDPLDDIVAAARAHAGAVRSLVEGAAGRVTQ